MARDTVSINKIALLATGDEIVNGDILNTNSQEIAYRLLSEGIHVGTHMIVADHIAEIEKAITFLLKDHSALIITGGLGPTSDDLTRFALSNAIQRPLVFDENTWQHIIERLKRFGYDTPPLSNRQQALFPEGASIIPNSNGTAAGCLLTHHLQLIFMLPGPPVECLPMFEKICLPQLIQSGLQEIIYHKHWFLFGVSEGQIAEELDALAKPYDCTTGYRLCYPYIEFKLHSSRKQDFNLLVPQIERVIQPYLIGDGSETASSLLQKELQKLTFTLSIQDVATGGLLETLLKTPATYTYLKFDASPNDAPHVVIKGLNEFWQNVPNTAQTQLEIDFPHAKKKNSICAKIPFRGFRVKHYAAEFICWKIIDFLKEFSTKYETEKR
ncbi:MAG: Competence damage inducible protein CinA [uncultured bacterium]|nr:MAG: Competence damage inducible protein CinA [uncultured bacterium]